MSCTEAETLIFVDFLCFPGTKRPINNNKNIWHRLSIKLVSAQDNPTGTSLINHAEFNFVVAKLLFMTIYIDQFGELGAKNGYLT